MWTESDARTGTDRLNLLLLLTAFMASLTGMIAGDRGAVRAGSVAAASIQDTRVKQAVPASHTSHRPSAKAPRLPLSVAEPLIAAAAPRLIILLGRRLI